MAKCRICLCCKPRKDVSELNITQNGETLEYKQVLMFCLGIQMSNDPNTNTKLCVKCYRKIIQFYDFKVLAIKNDETMRDIFTNTLVQNKIFFLDREVKDEADSLDSNTDILEEPLVYLNNNENGHGVDDTIEMKLEEHLEDSKINTLEETVEVINKVEYGHDNTENTNNIKIELKEEDESEDVVLSVIKHLKDKNQSTIDIKEKSPNRKRSKLKKVKVLLTPQERIERKREQRAKAGICEECGKVVKNIRQHRKQHDPLTKLTKYKCEHCDKVFSTPRIRRKHIQRKHLGFKKECNICGKCVFDLKMHMKAIHMRDSLKFECVHCKLKFLTQARLNLHVTIHTKDRPHQCDQCSACFRLKIGLDSHKRQTHDKEKSYTCHLCAKSFFKKDNLKNHIRSHTNEKPYECPDCGKCLQSSASLRNHRARHGVKNHKCTLCDAAFYTSNNLSQHMVSHLKVKRHPCRYCEAKFHRSDHRKRHEFTAHLKHGLHVPREHTTA